VRDSGLFLKELEEELLGFVLRLLRFKRNAFFEKVQERKHSSERSVRSERVIVRLTACRQLGLDPPNANEGGYKRNKSNYPSHIKALACSSID